MLKIGVLVSGGGTNLQAIIDAIQSGELANTSIEIVVSNNKQAYALERAAACGIPTLYLSPKEFEHKEVFGRKLVEELESFNLDLIVLAGYLVVLPELLIHRYPHKIINIHPSLIPSFCGHGYYGITVHKEAIARGVKITGATVHFVDEGTDTGPIILQKAVEVFNEDTPELLQKRVMQEAEWDILPRAIDLISKGLVSIYDGKVVIGGENERINCR